MNKRILLVILALTMLLGSFSFVSADISSHWAKGEIRYLMEQGVVNGYKDGNFKPNDPVTRAEFIKMINSALGLTRKGQVSFNDICDKCWFYDDIRIASRADYVSGYTDNTVKPNDNISREEASKMLGQAANIRELHTSTNSFKDSNRISSWARGYVNAMANEGYITGHTNGEFKPKDDLTRAQAATIIAKLMGYTKEESQRQAPEPAHSVSNYEREVHRLVNIERAKAGLGSLQLSSEISRVARDKSKDMAYGDYFSHTSPTFGSPFDMMRAYGIQFGFAGENIAAGHSSPEAVMRGWMNSDGHRRAILNPNYNKIGVGYFELNGSRYWTQMFTN